MALSVVLWPLVWYCRSTEFVCLPHFRRDIAKGQESCEREIGLHKNDNLKLKSKITELESEITKLKAG